MLTKASFFLSTNRGGGGGYGGGGGGRGDSAGKSAGYAKRGIQEFAGNKITFD